MASCESTCLGFLNNLFYSRSGHWKVFARQSRSTALRDRPGTRGHRGSPDCGASKGRKETEETEASLENPESEVQQDTRENRDRGDRKGCLDGQVILLSITFELLQSCFETSYNFSFIAGIFRFDFGRALEIYYIQFFWNFI